MSKLTHILAIGPFCWAKVQREEGILAAIKEAKRHGAKGLERKDFDIYLGPSDMVVDQMGRILWEDGTIMVERLRLYPSDTLDN